MDILKFYDKILNTSMVFNILLLYQKLDGSIVI